MRALLVMAALFCLACNEPAKKQSTEVDYVDPHEGAHHADAVREHSAKQALLTLLRGRHDGNTEAFDSVIRELATYLCGPGYDFSDIDKAFPPEHLDGALLAICGGYLLKTGRVVEARPPRIPDAGVENVDAANP